MKFYHRFVIFLQRTDNPRTFTTKCGRAHRLLPGIVLFLAALLALGFSVHYARQGSVERDIATPRVLRMPLVQAPGKLPSRTELQVTVLDVGQGDAMLVEFPNQQVMLVDAGSSDYGSLVVNALKQRNISRIDLLVATHPHEDHIGGMAAVLNAFTVGAVWDSGYNHGSRTQRNFLLLVQQYHIPLATPLRGVRRKFGDAVVEVLAPVTTILGSASDANNNSLVLRVSYHDSSMLLAADMEEEQRQSISRWPASTVLKVAHHGSHNGTDAAFLAQVRPQFAIISCAAQNAFGYPHAETVRALRQAAIPCMVTATDGAVTIILDGKGYAVQLAGTDGSDRIVSTDVPKSVGDGQARPVIGNRQSLAFHRLECPTLPAKHNRIPFSSRIEAIARGYHPCTRCNP